MYLYRTNFGLKIIDRASKRYAKLLNVIQYFVIVSGYLLMIIGTWYFIKFSYIYLTNTFLVEAIKVPVIFPLIPYFTDIFKIDYLPSFPFVTFIIVLILIAIPHEFAHGIFARFYNIRVHSTGFGFLRLFKIPLPFIGAFVEPDEKQMAKRAKKEQLSVLAAGTFANLITTILFGLIFVLFIYLFLTPAGVYFNTYSTKIIPIDNVISIDGVPINEVKIENNLEKLPLKYIQSEKENLTVQRGITNGTNIEYFVVYENSPAFEAKLSGPITYIDGQKITSYEILRTIIQNHEPGDNINIITLNEKNKTRKEQIITLADNEGKAFLGIGTNFRKPSGIFRIYYSTVAKIKNPFVYYESKLGDLGMFIYYILWWILFISLGVAFFNMLPVSILDGGRFFAITIWAITKRNKLGEYALKMSTLIFLALLAALTFRWIFAFIL